MTLPTRGSVPSPIIIPVTFRLRLEQNTEHAHHAYRHLRGRLPCAVKQFRPHRASEYALHLSGTDIGLLGVLLEGLSGNRHRFPHQEPSHNRSPAVLRLISGHVLVHCPFREPMPPANVCHLSAAGTPTASWSSALSGCQCLLRLSATSAPPGTPTASWHGDHAHKYSRGILAWRRGHLSTLWHGNPQQNHFWGRVTWQDCLEPVSNRSLADA